MPRRRLIALALALTLGLSLIADSSGHLWATAVEAQAPPESGQSWPPDTNIYTRPAIAQDRTVTAQALGITVRDPVVSNTDPTLTNTDTFGDSEPAIAINPANPNEIVITAFSGSWGTNAPLWHSTDGGMTWTKRFTIPIPPGLPAGCPCDQTLDYGRGHQLGYTVLKNDPPPAGSNGVYSGITTNPASAAAFNWRTVAGVAQRTNQFAIGDPDQPWLLVNRDPLVASQDNIYVAYDDFTISPRGMRIAVSRGANPPTFTTDASSGTGGGGGTNPGHRLAVDPRNGTVYSLYQRFVGVGAGGSNNFDYVLNRSTDGGVTWTLNGNPTGIVVANADSTQPTPKFGTVNALLGGVDHATVDPTTGDLYYVFGQRDAVTGNNRLRIARLTTNGAGTMSVASTTFVTGQVQAALPSVAVNSRGTIGVLYDTFDGFSGGFPQFTAHFATSTNHGATFSDAVLLTFLSPAIDNLDPRQRVLGDYQQVKAVGSTFYGTFTGNGVPLGRPFANTDPMFFKVTDVPSANLSVTKTDAPDPVSVGSALTYTMVVTNTGPDDAQSVFLRDALPEDAVTVVSVTPAGTCFFDTITVNCNFGTLPAGQSRTVVVVVRPTRVGTLINTVQVTSNTPDLTPGNNQATVTTTVTP